ncbi:MAG: hypothetical protein GF317_05580 [Candidatus Lokiarchaeota archaeon]|nr:hypothetical protein [Candidatus Lokiarchaeota archaeon]MBD3199278.1 hypothetical protein [Candidatus Lokiarchaeota archaeon]
MTVKALIFCKIFHSSTKRVVEQFNQISEIRKVFSLTGDYDILCEVQVENTEMLYKVFSEKIDPIEGIAKTNTHVIMKSWEK